MLHLCIFKRPSTGSESYFSWKNITYIHLICAFIIILSSYAQLRANYILSGLRKEKTGEINSTVYKIPHGGLFEYVSGALQITEIIIYISLSVILWQSSTYHYVTIWVIINQVYKFYIVFLMHKICILLNTCISIFRYQPQC